MRSLILALFILSLQPAPQNPFGTIEGLVTKAGSTTTPLAGAIVKVTRIPEAPGAPSTFSAEMILIPEAPRRSNSSLYRITYLPSDGRFQLSGITPGTYKLFALPYLNERIPYSRDVQVTSLSASVTKVREKNHKQAQQNLQAPGGNQSFQTSPQPPPPGVLMDNVSPASSHVVNFAGIFCTFPSDRITVLAPGSPGRPPDRPYGGNLRLSDSTVTLVLDRKRISRTTPSPPRFFPLPPEPLRSP
jgi:hypothetical protein